jgi:hypothetical protein
MSPESKVGDERPLSSPSPAPTPSTKRAIPGSPMTRPKPGTPSVSNTPSVKTNASQLDEQGYRAGYVGPVGSDWKPPTE